MDGGAWWATVHGVAKSQTWLSDFTSACFNLCYEGCKMLIFNFWYSLHLTSEKEKAMATHSSSLAWRRLWSMGSWRVFHFSLSRIREGNGNPLQCSCLEKPRDGGAWWAAVYGVTQSWTQLKQLSSSRSNQWKLFQDGFFFSPG